MASLQVCVFGKLRLQHGDARVEAFPTRRVEELLGYLVITPNTRHPREKLIASLWPDTSLSKGRASLSTALWRLRTVFERMNLPSGDYLEANREWIRLIPSNKFVLDLDEFSRWIKKAEETQNARTRESALLSAIEIYKGSFCEGIYAEWCLLERERLERKYLRALGQLMVVLMQNRNFEEAARTGLHILRRDPLREEVHRAVMNCYWKLGQRARAVRQFQRCARSLQSELQILPMPETVDLYQQIVNERLGELQMNGQMPRPYDEEIKEAYQTFLEAIEDLNALLEMAEERLEVRVTA